MAAKKKQKDSKLSSRSKFKIYGKHQAGIGSSSKGHAFSEFRKLKAVNEYKKYKRKQHKMHESVDKIIDDGIETSPKVKGVRNLKAKSKYRTARTKYEQEKAEKKKLWKEEEELQQKRKEDFKLKEEKRRDTNRNLSQKTKRGQPVMANHIECLLEKIERG